MREPEPETIRQYYQLHLDNLNHAPGPLLVSLVLISIFLLTVEVHSILMLYIVLLGPSLPLVLVMYQRNRVKEQFYAKYDDQIVKKLKHLEKESVNRYIMIPMGLISITISVFIVVQLYPMIRTQGRLTSLDALVTVTNNQLMVFIILVTVISLITNRVAARQMSSKLAEL